MTASELRLRCHGRRLLPPTPAYVETSIDDTHTSGGEGYCSDQDDPISERFDAWVVNVLVAIHACICGTFKVFARLVQAIYNILIRLALFMNPLGREYLEEELVVQAENAYPSRKDVRNGSLQPPVLVEPAAATHRPPSQFQLAYDTTAQIRDNEALAIVPYRGGAPLPAQMVHHRHTSRPIYPYSQPSAPLPYSSSRPIINSRSSIYSREKSKSKSKRRVPLPTVTTTKKARKKAVAHVPRYESSDESTSSISNMSSDSLSSSDSSSMTSTAPPTRRRSSSSKKQGRKPTEKKPSKRRSTGSVKHKMKPPMKRSSNKSVKTTPSKRVRSSSNKSIVKRRLSSSQSSLAPPQEEADAERYKRLPEVEEDLPDSYVSQFGQIGFAEWNRAIIPCLIVSPFDFEENSSFQKTWLTMARKHLRDHKSLACEEHPLKLFVYWFFDKTYSIVDASKFIPFDQGKPEWMELPKTIQDKLNDGKELTPREELVVVGLKEAKVESAKPVSKRKHLQKMPSKKRKSLSTQQNEKDYDNGNSNSSDDDADAYTELPKTDDDLPSKYRAKFGQIGFIDYHGTTIPCLIVSPFDFEEDSAFRKTWMKMARSHLRYHKSLVSEEKPLNLFVYWFLDKTYSIVGEARFIPFDQGEPEWMEVPKAIQEKIEAGKDLNGKEQMIVDGLEEAKVQVAKRVAMRSHFQKDLLRKKLKSPSSNKRARRR